MTISHPRQAEIFSLSIILGLPISKMDFDVPILLPFFFLILFLLLSRNANVITRVEAVRLTVASSSIEIAARVA